MTTKTTTENQNEAATPNEGELTVGELNKVVGGTAVVDAAKDAAQVAEATTAALTGHITRYATGPLK
jgi:hypothetical protein